MRRHALRFASMLVTFALLMPSAVPTMAAENPNRATDADPWGPCQGVSGSTLGHYNCDGMPDQASLEQSNVEMSNQAMPGNWYDLESPANLSARPYVESLQIQNSTEGRAIISSGTTSTTLDNSPGRLGVVIAPFNLCDKDRIPAPQTSGCYASPNRIGVTLVYRKSSGQVGYNFSRPNDGANPGNEIALKNNDGDPITVDENTEVFLKIHLNTIGKTLRWTWMNGAPSYWRPLDLGTDDATIEVRTKLAKMPIIDSNETYDNHTCTAVPISTCEVTQSNADWLTFQMVLSLDTTMSEAMTGALFATEGAIMGSVDVANDATTGLPVIKYAAASSHLTALGATRYGKMHAIIPASALVQQLGVPSFNNSTALPDSATPGQIFTTLREGSCTGSCSSGTTTFTEQVADGMGTDGVNGIRVDVDGLTFSAPKLRLKPKPGVLKAPSAKLTGTTYKITVASGSTSSLLSTANGVCKSKGCTVKLFKASTSKVSSALTLIATKTSAKNSNVNLYFTVTRKTTGATSSRVQTGTRYLVVVTRKDTGALVSSAPVVLP